MPIGAIWQTLIETPLINLLVVLSVLSFGSYGLGIIMLTLITRAITFPLTVRTLNATRRLQTLSPKLQEIQKKYSDPQRRSQETMKLYKEEGVNPIGCLGPQLIQMPIFIALYQIIRITVGSNPESVLYLETRLYDLELIRNAVPLSTRFLFMDLSANGNFLLVLIVFAGMWLQQRISSSGSKQTAGSQQAQMTQTMQWMMPIFFAWFVLVVPAGLGMYWAATTVIGLILQWKFVGPGDFTWGSLIPAPVRARLLPNAAAARVPVRATAPPVPGPDDGDTETRQNDGTSSRSQRNRRRGRGRSRAAGARPQSQSGRRRRRPRR